MVQYLDKNSGFRQWAANRDLQNKNNSGFRRWFWWFVVILIAWWGTSVIVSDKNTKQPDVINDKDAEIVTSLPVHVLESENISMNTQGARISNIQLKKMPKVADKNNNDVVSLLSDNNEYIETGLIANGTSAPGINTVWKQIDNNTWGWTNSDGIVFTKHIDIDGHIIHLQYDIKNNSKRDVSFAPYAHLSYKPIEKNSAGVATGALSYVNAELEENDWNDLDEKSFVYSTTNGFTGFAEQYWETILSFDAPDQTIRIKKQGNIYSNNLDSLPIQIVHGNSKSININIFTGPRDQNVLNNVETTIPGIAGTVDYGWFGFIARPMLWALNGLNSVVGNYGLAIIIFTILLRVLIWPLTRKSYTSMIAMQKMQPELQKIQKLYSNDKARLQLEMMRLYQTHKTSPMSGCLPMLIQIPIFFALYKALLVSVPMRHAMFLWMHDLSVMDPYFILPILMGVTMWWQQKLQSASKKINNDSNDPLAQTQKFMKWMPILFTVMFAWMPAGLVLYWTVSNVFGIGQMYYLKRNK